MMKDTSQLTKIETASNPEEELRVVVRRERRLRTAVRAGDITTRGGGCGGECGSA